MNDDILKFRRTCDVLLNEKGYTRGSICKEAGLSEPTLQKLLNDELDSFKRDGNAGMRSSTLAIIQDFNKRHRDDLNYAGIKSEKAPKETKTGKVEFEQSNKEKEVIHGIPTDLDGIRKKISDMDYRIITMGKCLNRLLSVKPASLNTNQKTVIDIEIRVNGKPIRLEQ